MKLSARLRNLVSGPERVTDPVDDGAEFDAATSEDYGTESRADAGLERLEERSGRYAGGQAVQAAEEDLETEEAPPDPDP